MPTSFCSDLVPSLQFITPSTTTICKILSGRKLFANPINTPVRVPGEYGVALFILLFQFRERCFLVPAPR